MKIFIFRELELILKLSMGFVNVYEFLVCNVLSISSMQLHVNCLWNENCIWTKDERQ